MNELISLCTRWEAVEVDQGPVHEATPVFNYFREHFAFFSAMFSNQRALIFRDRLQHFISVSLMDKTKKTNHKLDVDDEIAAQFMASAFVGIVEWWIRNQMPRSAEYMADQVRKLFDKNQV
ncbi:TetR-like C-terminal domain-containing protein [Paenibacillus sp. 1P07SE]|uniref:TetR-like C-terminal domain-containing protein n=1 Tax=Paenibacillus sp. 1P07SE TaxID=3132209 RepID=UPI0039A44206